MNFRDGHVTAFSAGGALIDRWFAGAGAGRILFTPDGRTALVVSTGDATVAAYDVQNRRRGAVATLAAGPKVIALSRDGRRAYVTHPDRGALSLIDVPSMTVLHRVSLPGAPDGVAVFEPSG